MATHDKSSHPATKATKATKRKTSTSSSNAGSIGRKRAQNRISQQCLREKNLAYMRSLEDTVELLQKSATSHADSGDRQDRYAVLYEAYLKQTRENQRLREALLRLRKKLLSLSNAAAADADDEIFSSILGHSGEGEGSPGGDVPDQGPSPPTQVQTQLQGQDDAEPSSEPAAVVFGDAESLFPTDGDDDLPAMFFGQDHLGIDDVDMTALPVPSPGQAIPCSERIAISSATVFGAKLISACQQCIQRAGPLLASGQETASTFGDRLIAAAAHFSACCFGLESYIYGVNGARYIEKILSWRLGLATRDGVPAPFRPTPLQSRDLTHHLTIDLFNWPDVRDQLVLEQDAVDLDMLTKDLILHSVIDQPQRGVAVSVWDVFYNQILRRDKTHAASARNFLNDPSWVLFEVGGPVLQNAYSSPYEADPVEQAIVAELEQRMQTLPAASQTQHGDPPQTGEAYRLSDVAVFLGLDKMDAWKLSKDFTKKYPFLDCSTAVAACDVASSATVFCW